VPCLSLGDLVEQGIDHGHAAAWFKVRKDKGAKTLTQVAWDAFKAEVEKAGIPLAQAVHICVIANWQGFKAGWDWQQHAPGAQVFHRARGSPQLAPQSSSIPSPAETARALREADEAWQKTLAERRARKAQEQTANEHQ